MKIKKESVMAKLLKRAAEKELSTAANSKCAFVFHQPIQPESVKRYRKF